MSAVPACYRGAVVSLPAAVPIRAITLDLDDTLWPIWPTIVRAEESLHEWLERHAPRTAMRFPVLALRALRERVAQEHPELSHDFATQRRLTLVRALRESGEDTDLAGPAFEVFTALRNRVDPFPGVIEALARLARCFPVAAITNGTSDLARIGIDEHFVFGLCAHEHGVAKPDAAIFHAACKRLGVAPDEVLHVGDDPELDVRGAYHAGLRSAWINRDARAWPLRELAPDYIARDLVELVEHLQPESIHLPDA